MTKIDFHILPTLQADEVFQYVARLTQKARDRKLNVLIATENAEQNEQVSQALWGFQPSAFIPHQDISEPHLAIQLSHTEHSGEHHDVLINLREKIPEFFSRFERVFEVVCQQPQWLSASRERYRFYQDHGYSIDRHDLRDRV